VSLPARSTTTVGMSSWSPHWLTTVRSPSMRTVASFCSFAFFTDVCSAVGRTKGRTGRRYPVRAVEGSRRTRVRVATHAAVQVRRGSTALEIGAPAAAEAKAPAGGQGRRSQQPSVLAPSQIRLQPPLPYAYVARSREPAPHNSNARNLSAHVAARTHPVADGGAGGDVDGGGADLQRLPVRPGHGGEGTIARDDGGAVQQRVLRECEVGGVPGLRAGGRDRVL